LHRSAGTDWYIFDTAAYDDGDDNKYFVLDSITESTLLPLTWSQMENWKNDLRLHTAQPSFCQSDFLFPLAVFVNQNGFIYFNLGLLLIKCFQYNHFCIYTLVSYIPMK